MDNRPGWRRHSNTLNSTAHLDWPEGVLPVPLPSHDVHVWAARLDGWGTRELAEAKELLSPFERVRSDRFVAQLHRDRYVARHASLRILLGSYLRCSPSSIQFKTGPRGKPELADGSQDPIHFNQSTSSGLGLFAFTRAGPVGIDLEHIRPLPELAQILQRHFSAHEREGIARLPEPDRLAAFFAAWTLKEAFLKATGDGIADHLTEVEMAFDQSEGRRLRGVVLLDGSVMEPKEIPGSELQSLAPPSAALTPGVASPPVPPGVTPPRLIQEVRAGYTPEAMRQKISGTVLIQGIVGVDGGFHNLQVVRSLDTVYGLDDAALKAASQWRFIPGMKDGQPVPVAMTVELAFYVR